MGLENDFIKDKQLSAFSAYNNDPSTFGAHRARLNLNTWPPGYRADKKSLESSTGNPWLMVDLGREVVITGIATQGYGDTSVSEWVTSYRLMHAVEKLGSVYYSFMDANGDVQVIMLSTYSVIQCK